MLGRRSLLMEFAASHQAPGDVGRLQRGAFGWLERGVSRTAVVDNKDRTMTAVHDEPTLRPLLRHTGHGLTPALNAWVANDPKSEVERRYLL
jgi:hypothetical protein